ncbi:MAG: peptide/nickel transport system ATP-binding protein [Solirubrobacteraceae bacterium]
MSALVADVDRTSAAAPRRHLLSRVVRRPLGAVSLVVLVALVAAVIAAPLIAPYQPLAQDLHAVFQGPSGHHLLGTDNLGRDVLSRLLYGGRVSLLGVVYAVGVLLVLGVPIGLLAGYLGGRFDAVVVWVTDVLLAIPVIITLLVVLAVFGQNETAAMITFGVLGTPGMIRVVRGAALAIRRELYITAARVFGLSTPQILRRHVLPRIAGPIIVRTFLFAGAALLTETALSFLGLGVQEPNPSWGGMVANASNVINQHAWLLVPPGAAIALCVMALGLLGDAVRDAFTERRTSGPWKVPARRTSAGLDVAPPAASGALLSMRVLSVALPSPTGWSTVVENVSFDVRPGETVGLVGESACGKSVTGKAILGLLPAGGRVVGGSCRFDGTELTRLTPAEYRALRGSQIALISQEPVASLDPNYRVGDQVAQVVRRHQGLPRRAARVRAVELLRRVELRDPEDVARRYPHELSGGMAQRVCIAAALAGNPRLLIADEPTTALDVTVQAEILDLLRELQQQTGMSILLITHDWAVVADLCDRAMVMYAGQIVESTEVRAMFRQPLHPYTYGLMSSNPHGAAVGDRLPAIAGTVPPPDAWPEGCHFQPRCPLATGECAIAAIPMAEPAAGRLTRCIHHDELVGAAQR